MRCGIARSCSSTSFCGRVSPLVLGRPITVSATISINMTWTICEDLSWWNNIDFRLQLIRLHTMFILLHAVERRPSCHGEGNTFSLDLILGQCSVYIGVWLRPFCFICPDCVKDPNCTKLILHSLTPWADQTVADAKSLLTLCLYNDADQTVWLNYLMPWKMLDRRWLGDIICRFKKNNFENATKWEIFPVSLSRR